MGNILLEISDYDDREELENILYKNKFRNVRELFRKYAPSESYEKISSLATVEYVGMDIPSVIDIFNKYNRYAKYTKESLTDDIIAKNISFNIQIGEKNNNDRYFCGAYLLFDENLEPNDWHNF